MIIVNFKNYKTGKRALELSKLIEKNLPNAIVCVSSLDVENISSRTKLKVFAQHLDSVEGKKSTGFLSANFLERDGGKGSLLNHSEHRISSGEIEKTIKEAEKFGLKIILCVENLHEVEKYKKFRPWAMAFEDKKLIGSGKSITEFESEDVRKFCELLKRTKIIPICGAGISTAEDVRAARKLGCRGVLIASAMADSPRKKVEKLLKEISII